MTFAGRESKRIKAESIEEDGRWMNMQIK